MNRNFLRLVFSIFVPLFFLLTSCREEEPQPVSPVQEVKNEVNNHINSWIYDNMKYWYLWNSDLPASTDTATTAREGGVSRLRILLISNAAVLT